MHKMTKGMQNCIDECLRCYQQCWSYAMQHCLERGGKHVEPAHFRLMLACAELCQASADLMLIGSPLHRQTCAVCAEACEACAESCDSLGGMEECAKTCRTCAEACRKMAAAEKMAA